MFKKILIANRGAIAVRIIKTLNKMGIASVSVYAESDRDSLHVSAADQAFSLGGGQASETYLNFDKLFSIAKKCGVDAIHPGYGFLSENAEFVRRCDKEGVIFIGPKAEHIEAFGLKHTAREIAQNNKISMLPGSEVLESEKAALDVAEEIGYPVMLKSSAGGGGIGMQVCRTSEELSAAYGSVKRLSANNFSNDAVFLEKYIEFARHIEVQVFGDGKGQAVAFGERDCSAQRRHQKVIEETPAPNLENSTREEITRQAIDLVSAVKYQNSGTVEFIFDTKDNKFYFLEVNTRLQVEHGVTEQVFGLDLVEWMVKLAAGKLGDITSLRKNFRLEGHAIQIRLYAENPVKNFQPSAGLLCDVKLPEQNGKSLRIDTWVEAGVEVSPYFDPMLAKVIVYENSRDAAIDSLLKSLDSIKLLGIETNKEYSQAILSTQEFRAGEMYTRFLNDFVYSANTIDVLSPGTMTTIQDFPGRTGYWDVGVPPSGPFDNHSFRLANRLVGNPEGVAALEITLNGPTLKFNVDTNIAICGAEFSSELEGNSFSLNRAVRVKAGQILKVGKVKAAGARAYLALEGGLDGHDYLGSKSTFTLGNFGGFSGRALRTGDVLHLSDSSVESLEEPPEWRFPEIGNNWVLHTIYGPHGAPDFFTKNDIKTFFESEWTVHYNSSRTGIRLIGPKPEWARDTGGEAGMHPSNIHDNAYAIGTIDFTGDMPVILGPDGPSLGGFVCPATVITADLWKLGQLKAGDKIKFALVDFDEAKRLEEQQFGVSPNANACVLTEIPETPILRSLSEDQNGTQVIYRPAGDRNLLVEYGPQVLDLRLRFRVHGLMQWLHEKNLNGLFELTPGIRSLQIKYDPHIISIDSLLDLLVQAEVEIGNMESLVVPSRIVNLPLSWDDDACRLAVEKYMQSVRKDAPWCPSNLEFIRRINGLESIDEVKEFVFDSNYVVMGLGDVYLGAPVATPLDPRRRLVTTKYNPARTWTAENSVGIGGAYLCIYGMEGPGGYQFVGRTLQMWNKYKQTNEFERPWLLRFFDQIRFYEVSAEELENIREDFPRGKYRLDIQKTEFSLKEYEAFLEKHNTEIQAFTEKRNTAFNAELERWVESGQINFESTLVENDGEEEGVLSDGEVLVESSVAGNVWQWQVVEGDSVSEGQVVCVLESMKMEIEIYSNTKGIVKKILRQQGQPVNAGQGLVVVEEN